MPDAAGGVAARRRHPQVATSWNRLFEMLGGRLGEGSYHLGNDLVHVAPSAGRVMAHFADGATAEQARAAFHAAHAQVLAETADLDFLQAASSPPQG